MGPLTHSNLLHNFPNSNSWIIRFFCGPFSFELDKFDCILCSAPDDERVIRSKPLEQEKTVE